MNRFRKKGSLVPALLLCLALLIAALSGCGDRAEPAPTDGAAPSRHEEDPQTPIHPPPPIAYDFNSLRELAAVYHAKKQGLAAPAGLTENAAALLESEEDASLLFDTFGNLPFPVLGGAMPLYLIEYKVKHFPRYPSLYILYNNSATGDFIRFCVSPEETMREYVERNYPDTESFAVKEFGGQTVDFYLDEEYEGDLRRMRGVFEVDGVAVVITCGRYPYENPENITFDYFTAPLEHLTVSTLYGQMGVEPDAPISGDEPDRSEYEFHSIRAMQTLWNAAGQDDKAVETISGKYNFELFGRGGPYTVAEAKSIFDGMGALPFAVLDGVGGMSLTRVNYCHWGPERPDEVETVYQNRYTKNFFRMIVKSGLSYPDCINGSFAEETLLQTYSFGGYEMRVYENGREDLKDDVWNSVGLINADGAAILVCFGSESEEERGKQVSVDSLVAPLEQLTVSTLYEQMGVEP